MNIKNRLLKWSDVVYRFIYGDCRVPIFLVRQYFLTPKRFALILVRSPQYI